MTMDGYGKRTNSRYDRANLERGSERDIDRESDRGYERGGDRFDRSSLRRTYQSTPAPSLSIEDVENVVSKLIDDSNKEQLEVVADMFVENKADRRDSEKSIVNALNSSLKNFADDINDCVRAAVDESIDAVMAANAESGEVKAANDSDCSSDVKSCVDDGVSSVREMIDAAKSELSDIVKDSEAKVCETIEEYCKKSEEVEAVRELPSYENEENEDDSASYKESLSRIERIVAQNAEALDQDSEMLERNVSSLRENAESINSIKSNIDLILNTQKRIETKVLEQSSNRYDEEPKSVKSVDDEAKNDILTALSDNRSLLNMIRLDIINLTSKDRDEDKVSKAPVVDTLSSEAAKELFKELEETVHKENVKCYRNVQAAFTEANEANKPKTEEKKSEPVNVLLVCTLVASVLDLAFNVVRFLGLI